MIAQNALIVTPSDTTYLSKFGFVRNGGATAINIRVLPIARENSDTPGDGVLFSNVQSGQILPIYVKKVFATNTTGSATIELLVP